MENDSIDRIRSATFAVARRGYDKREVDNFLSRLADWLEAGGGDRARSDTVKRELERVGQKTSRILTDAEETAQQLREEADREAKESVRNANAQGDRTRKEADEYARQTTGTADEYSKKTHSAADRYDAERRREADAYSTDTRTKADEYSETVRSEADRQAIETVKAGEAKAQRIVDEGNKRRQDIETVISDLARRRDGVLAQIEKLSGELQAAVAQHRPAPGQDQFAPGAASGGGIGSRNKVAGDQANAATAEEPAEDETASRQPKPRAKSSS
ncbi:MAG: DivIVA protein [Solirubrobacterales bacterium]|nr:DivIVA protein [Solirubrobacterales bacterium]MDX6663413.1 DivIVA protein [Solirubrobacterales bacterium]